MLEVLCRDEAMLFGILLLVVEASAALNISSLLLGDGVSEKISFNAIFYSELTIANPLSSSKSLKLSSLTQV